jgi:two-component system, sensor histidine kinase and response regulator
MTKPFSAPLFSKTHLPAAEASASFPINNSTRWLVGSTLLGLALVFGLRIYFDHLETQIKLRGDNEQARLYVGEEIVRSSNQAEKEFYRLAITPDEAGVANILNHINHHLDELLHDLDVLQNGGTPLRLTVDIPNEVPREAVYRPETTSQPMIVALTELRPQINKIRERTNALLPLLNMRWLAMNAGRSVVFLGTEKALAAELKQISPEFERINIDANRLLLESEQRLRAIQADLALQSKQLRQMETLLLALVVLLGAMLVLLYMRRLSRALKDIQRARDETNDQREQNAAILDTLADGVYTTDLNGIITYVNAAAVRMLGWSAADLIGKNAHAAIHHMRANGAPYPQNECQLFIALTQGDALHGEDHVVHRDGHCIPVSFGARPLRLKGELAGSLLSFQDITERLAARSRLRLQQAALDAAANAIVITNRDGMIDYVNPAFTQTTGYSAAEAIGQSTSMLRSGVHDNAFYRALWQTLLSGKPWEGELINRRKSGELYPEQMTVTPIIDNGVIAHFVAIKRDISEDVRTRTQLKLIESAIGETNQGIHIMDATPHPDGPLIQYVNAGFCRITGYSAQQCLGQRLSFLRSPHTTPDEIAQIRQAIAQGDSLTQEVSYQRRDGTSYVGELHLSPVHNEQAQLTHYIGVLTDIGLRKQAEAALRDARDQALENSRLKSEFLSTMSHEIRTPMNGIVGMTNLLLDTQLNAEQREFADMLHDSAQVLMDIINDILDFSKIEAGKLEIELARFDLAQVLQSSVVMLGNKAREKSLTLSCQIDPSLPRRLMGDPTRLRQVVLNLVGNAVKFTETGSVTLRARQVNAVSGNMLRIDVNDTGIGIADTTQERLFQSFTQADSSTTRRYGGTGLGLAICKRLVELMGGRIGVHSVLGQGANFWFTLPLLPADAEHSHELTKLTDPPAITSSVPPHPDTPPTRQHLLLAEDNEINQRVAELLLTRLGYTLDIVDNGQLALEAVVRSLSGTGPVYAAVLMDCQMPVMDGLEATAAIRCAEMAGQARLPIIALTANAMQGDRERCLAAGMDDYLSKPLQPKLLCRVLDQWLGPAVQAPVPTAAQFENKSPTSPI